MGSSFERLYQTSTSFITWLHCWFSGRKTEEDKKREKKVEVKRRPNFVWMSGANSYELKFQIFFSLFENKEGTLFQLGRGIINDICSKEDTIIAKETQNNWFKTYIFHKACWTRDDLKELVASCANDHHSTWIRSGLDGNAISQITSEELEKFWDLILGWEIDGEEEVPSNGIEYLGFLNDGYHLLWLNPSPEKVDTVLGVLRNRAMELGIEIEDI